MATVQVQQVLDCLQCILLQVIENQYVPQWVVDKYVQTQTEEELAAFARSHGGLGPGPFTSRHLFDEELQHAHERQNFPGSDSPALSEGNQLQFLVDPVREQTHSLIG